MTLKANEKRAGKCKQKRDIKLRFSSWLWLNEKGNWKAGQLFTLPSLHIYDCDSLASINYFSDSLLNANCKCGALFCAAQFVCTFCSRSPVCLSWHWATDFFFTVRADGCFRAGERINDSRGLCGGLRDFRIKEACNKPWLECSLKTLLKTATETENNCKPKNKRQK